MPMCNSSHCKTNSYVCSVSVESKSSGTTHIFKKENYSTTCQELLLKEYFCFLFLYAPTMIHPTMGRKDADAEQTNQKNHISKHQAVKINQATSTSFTQ